jgi:hypothetical protein
MESSSENTFAEALQQIRSGSDKMSGGFWAWLSVACLFLIAAVFSILPSRPTAGVGFLAAALGFVVSAICALTRDRRRRDAALLSEIDRLRALVEGASSRSDGHKT